MRTSVARSVVFLLVAAASPASIAAQTPPPPYIRIFREEVKPGRNGAHVIAEANWPRAFGRAKTQNYYVAMTTQFGPAEAWFLEGYPSVAAIAAADKAVSDAPGLQADLDRFAQADAANINSVRTLLMRYVPELSNAPASENPANARYWEITVFRVRPGKEASFAEGAKLYQSLVQKSGAKSPWAVYNVLAGMPGPTFLVFSPHRELAEIDPATGANAQIEAAMTAENMKQFGTISEGFISVETFVFAPSPEMSYLSAEWIATDPKFWGRKAAAPRPGP